MKRLFFIFVVSLFVFSACFGGALKIDFLSFYSDDAVELQIVPDYDDGSLSVEYFETGELIAEGNVGLEYFDRFNKLVKILHKSDFSVSASEYFVEEEIVFGAHFGLIEGGSFVVSSFDGFTEKNFSFLQSFYIDLLNLLTQEVPV